MTKAILTEIEIDYNYGLTDAELEKIKLYNKDFKFKELDDFKPWGQDKTEEQKLEEAKIKYDEYLLKERKELPYNLKSLSVDISIFVTQFPLVKFKVIGSKEVNVDIKNSNAITLQQKAIDDMIKQHEVKLNSMMNMFVQMSEKIGENLKIDTLNQKCDVHIGGGLLMTVNETLLLSDSCTDVLQDSLYKGWRILAVCVQPDGRRPDYILGRFNPNL